MACTADILWRARWLLWYSLTFYFWYRHFCFLVSGILWHLMLFWSDKQQKIHFPNLKEQGFPFHPWSLIVTLILSHRTVCSRTHSFAQSHLFTKFGGGQHSVLGGEGELKIVRLERTDEGFSSENNMWHSNNMRPENCWTRKCTNSTIKIRY